MGSNLKEAMGKCARIHGFSISLMLMLTCSAVAIAAQPEQELNGRMLIEEFANDDVIVVYTVDARGLLVPRPIATVSYDYILRYYADPSVVQELELAGKQKETFKSIVDQWSSRQQTLLKEYEQASKRGVEWSNQVLKKFRELDTEMQDLVKQELIDYQVEKLYQIQARFLLRTRGFKSLITLGPTNSGFALSENERRRTIERMARLKSEVEEKAKELRDLVVQEWLNPLSQKEREEVLLVWKDALGGDNPRIEQLQLWFAEASVEDDKRTSVSLTNSQSLPQYQLAIDGTLRQDPPVEYKSADAPGSIFRRTMWFLRDPIIQSQLELTESQRNEITLTSKEYQSSRREVQKKYFTDAGEEIFSDDRKKELEALANNYLARFQRIALPHQLEQLEKISDGLSRKINGPVIDLTVGELGKELKLTKEVRERLRKGADKAAEVLADESRKIERYVYTELFDLLDDDSKRKLDYTFGPPLTKSPGSLQLLLHHLSTQQ